MKRLRAIQVWKTKERPHIDVRQSKQSLYQSIPNDSLIRLLVERSPQGYPRLAAFLDSEDTFMLFRRFGFLQARLLLEKQAELHLLEGRLEKLDNSNESKDPTYSTTRDLPAEVAEPRAELLRKIEKTWCEYGTIPRPKL